MSREGVEFGAAALRVMRARSAGRCEGCGRAGVRLEAHHVRFRSRGGDGGAGNGLLLCGSGNHSGCHGRAHSGEGAELGWAAPSAGAAVAVRHVRFGRCWLTDEGLVLAADGVPCWEHRPGVGEGCSACLAAGRVLWDFESERGWA